MTDGMDKAISTFKDFVLDDRLLRAIEKLGWETPTLIQKTGISLGLEGKDINARARTGSGKTATYSIPIVDLCLRLREKDDNASGIRAIVLVPTKELCYQTYKHISQLTKYCSDVVSCVALSSVTTISAQKPLVAGKPDIIVGTPSRVLAHFKAKNIHFKKLSCVVFDEADLLFSFGYEEDVRTLVSHFPSTIQSFFMSATMTKDVEKLQNLIMTNPVVLKLQESHLPQDTHLQQHVVKCAETDKYLLLYSLLAFKIISGKTILFVNSINSCYKLKLFLDTFCIKTCILNSDLPYNSRYHIVEEFNRGVYDIIIASDESIVLDDDTDSEGSDVEDEEDDGVGCEGLEQDSKYTDNEPSVEIEYVKSNQKDGNTDNEEANSESQSSDDESNKHDMPEAILPNKPIAQDRTKTGGLGNKNMKKEKEGEYAMARGVDFQDVEWVINVDFPTHANSYIHRVGRTARAGKHGNALSFLSSVSQQTVLGAIEKKIGNEYNSSDKKKRMNNKKTAAAAGKVDNKNDDTVLKPYEFPLSKVKKLRYRVDDALQKVSKARVKAARLKDIRSEMINSEKLKLYFQENPRDFQVLKHNNTLDTSIQSMDTKSIPSYLRPHRDDITREATALANEHAPKKKKFSHREYMYNKRKANMNKRKSSSAAGSKRHKKGGDPLKSFSLSK